MAEDLMRETREERMGEQDNREEEMAEEPEEIFYADAADFAIELLKGDRKGKDGDNVMVSPLSVMTAMAITANGAGGYAGSDAFRFWEKPGCGWVEQEPESVDEWIFEYGRNQAERS